jgi:hypothetical protein
MYGREHAFVVLVRRGGDASRNATLAADRITYG